MSARRLYLCGPMTGLPDFNRPAFNAAAGELRAAGRYEVMNPAERDLGPDAEWGDYMRAALIDLLTCDVVVLLDGWQQSRGALIESDVAARVGCVHVGCARPVKARQVCQAHYESLRRTPATAGPVPGHPLTLSRRDSIAAECGCGWAGPAHALIKAALTDHVMHLRDVTEATS